MELTDTIEMMTSEDYKERFQAEYQQLVIRFKKLKDMLDKWDKGELNFLPTCPRGVYNLQIRAMADYIAVLEARAAIEQVPVWDVTASQQVTGKLKTACFQAFGQDINVPGKALLLCSKINRKE